MANNRIAIDFRHTTVYFETSLNAVGATTSITLRDAPAAPGVNDAYMKKYGTAYPITDMLAGSVIDNPQSDGGGANTWQWEFEGYDPTTDLWTNIGVLRDTLGGSVFTDGAVLAAAATMVRIRLVVVAGTTAALVDGDTITMITDLDGGPGGLTVLVPGENINVAFGPLDLFLSSSGSTYYTSDPDDPTSEMVYGGFRHTPVIASAKYPYPTFAAAIPAIGGAGGTIIEVMDSETYDTGGVIVLGAGYDFHAALGHTPTITSGAGARYSRTPNVEYNNATAIYVHPNGNDADPGTWHQPNRTLAIALFNAIAAGSAIVIGGLGAGIDPLFVVGVAVNNVRVVACAHGIIGHITSNFPVIANAALTIRNVEATCTSNEAAFDGVGAAIICQDCTGHGGSFGFHSRTGVPTFTRCRADNTFTGIRISGATTNATIDSCDIISCVNNGIETVVALGAGTAISNNVIAHCNRGIWLGGLLGAVGGINHNTISNCVLYGLYLPAFGPYATIPFANIITDCAVGVWADAVPTTITINFCAIANNTADTGGLGVVTENAAIAGDPLLCDPSANRFGVQPISPCYHANGAGDDVGAVRNLLSANVANQSIDGFIIDGQDSVFHGIYQNANRSGWSATWCTFKDFGGVAVDIYGTAATGASLLNLILDACGAGIALPDTGNIVEETIAFATSSIAIWIDNTGNTLDHVSLYGGQYGIYATALGGFTIVNSIFSFQSFLAIFSPTGRVISFCCIDGAVSALVDISAASNVLSSPLFVSTTEELEDFHLWSIAGGFPIDSPCIDAASDGFDLGCYLIDRGITDGTWETYILLGTVLDVAEPIVAKSEKGFEVVTGSHSLAAKTHKRRVNLSWTTDTAADDEQFRHMIELFSTFVEDDHQGWTPEQIILRVHLKPIRLQLARFVGLVDADALTIYNAAAAWDRNAYRGYDATCEWYESVVGVLDDVAKTLAVAGAPWVVDEWAGYWFPQALRDRCNVIIGYRWFLVLSNTVNTITYSDPYDLSVSVAADFPFAIVSWHKIASNDAQYMCLEEEDRDLLRDGETPHVYVDILRTRLQRSGVTIRGGMDYSSDQEQLRIPDRLRLEEI